MWIGHRVGPLVVAAAALISIQTFTRSAPAPKAEGTLQVKGRSFVDRSGRPFTWLGVTAFGLLDHVADGREQAAVGFMRWASRHGFTLVRVLGMARNLFQLSPADGLRALPRLLALAETEGLAVELVIFADTRDFPDLDYQVHVRAVARAVEGAPNLLIELANENEHRTQDPRLADPAFLLGLRRQLPKTFAVSLGSLHGGDDRIERYPGGDYVTIHVSRSGDPWDNVRRVAGLPRLSEMAKMPVVSDEPIGAGERDHLNRRVSNPAVFFGLGLLGRMAGVPTTFHCEDCLHARPPAGIQGESAAAFIEGGRLLPASLDLSLHERYSRGEGGPLSRPEAPGVGSIHVATDSTGRHVFVAAVGVSGDAAIPWRHGWSIERLGGREGLDVFRASPSR